VRGGGAGEGVRGGGGECWSTTYVPGMRGDGVVVIRQSLAEAARATGSPSGFAGLVEIGAGVPDGWVSVTPPGGRRRLYPNFRVEHVEFDIPEPKGGGAKT
jgi:hypothetical protein